jgi:hypothetical protein
MINWLTVKIKDAIKILCLYFHSFKTLKVTLTINQLMIIEETVGVPQCTMNLGF